MCAYTDGFPVRPPRRGWRLDTRSAPQSTPHQAHRAIMSYAVDPPAFRTRHGGDLISPPKGLGPGCKPTTARLCVLCRPGVHCLHIQGLSARCGARVWPSRYSQCFLHAWHRPPIGANSRPVAGTSSNRLSLPSRVSAFAVCPFTTGVKHVVPTRRSQRDCREQIYRDDVCQRDDQLQRHGHRGAGGSGPAYLASGVRARPPRRGRPGSVRRRTW